MLPTEHIVHAREMPSSNQLIPYTYEGKLHVVDTQHVNLSPSTLQTRYSIFDVFGVSSASGAILYSSLGKTLDLYLLPPDGGAEQVIAQGIAWADWSPSGTAFIYWTSGGELYLVDPLNVNRHDLLAENIRSASFSPDEKSVAILRNTSPVDQGIYSLDLSTRQERLLTADVLTHHDIRGYSPVWSADGRYLIFLRDTSLNGISPIGIIDSKQAKTYAVQSYPFSPLPNPNTPLYLIQGRQLIYGTMDMDAPSFLYVLDLDFEQGTVNKITRHMGYWPVDWFESDRMLLVESASGLYLVNGLEVKDLESSADLVQQVTSSTLYNVKYKAPVGGGINYFFDHDTTSNIENYNCGTNNVYNGHKGTDFAASLGTSVKGTALGVVEAVYNGCAKRNYCPDQEITPQCEGFGNYVRVKNNGNNARTIYAHLSNVNVAINDPVSTATTIGKAGSTGNSTDCHLHFEVRWPTAGSADAVDPFYGGCNWITESLWNGPQPLRIEP